MSNCSPGSNRFFGPVQTHIKMYQGSFVAVEGPNMTHKMSSLPSIRFPYQQILSARITLRAGQTNYLLNHLGLGDNATFLAITAQYDENSKFEADNYVQYSYYSNKHTLLPFAQMLVLTGNSENRIEQLYLHNPNQNSIVVLEVMVAIIDEYYDFFTQNEGGSSVSTNLSYANLMADDIALWDTDNGVLIVKNNLGQALLYLNLGDINSWTTRGRTITIDDDTIGDITLNFITEADTAISAFNLASWLNDYNNQINPTGDQFAPIITFTSSVVHTGSPGTFSSPQLTSKDDTEFLLIPQIILSSTEYGGLITTTNSWITTCECTGTGSTTSNPCNGATGTTGSLSGTCSEPVGFTISCVDTCNCGPTSSCIKASTSCLLSYTGVTSGSPSVASYTYGYTCSQTYTCSATAGAGFTPSCVCSCTSSSCTSSYSQFESTNILTGGTVSKLQLTDIIITNVNDFLGYTVSMGATGNDIRIMSGTYSIDSITQSGIYIINFDIADGYGNSVDPSTNVKITVTDF